MRSTRKITLFSLIVILLLLITAKINAAESENITIAKALSNAYAEVAAIGKPTVVAIQTVKEIELSNTNPMIPQNLPPQLRNFFKEFQPKDLPRSRTN